MIQISPRQAEELMQRGDLDVIDVREPHEWLTGHIAGARLVPLGSLRTSPQSALKHDGVIFVCAAGMRSQTAARVAEAHGLTKVYNLVGGTRGWTQAGLPLVREDLGVAV
jgi:rhodanese-related sulfurtransferase